MTHDEPAGCLHPTNEGEECEICAERADARILAMKTAELRAECREAGMDPDGIVAEVDEATRKAILSVLSTRHLMREVIRRLNYDGHDLGSLTVAEIQRAVGA
jgi:hypothetical protein